MKVNLKIFILNVLILLSLNIKAQVQSSLENPADFQFKHEMSIVEGEVESYSLHENSEVKLLIALLDKKNLFAEAKNSSEADLKVKFLERAKLLDFINGQSERELIGLKRTETDGKISLKLKFSLTKENFRWIESNTYVISSEGAALASLQYPIALPLETQKNLQNGIETIQLNGITGKSVFFKIVESFNKLIASYDGEQAGTIFISKAFAETAKDEFIGCHDESYITGDFTTRPGSALLNFSKIASDLKNEVILNTLQKEKKGRAKTDDSKIICLMNDYKAAKENATEYWSKKGTSEACIVKDKILTAPTTSCSDSTLKEMNKSFSYLNRVDQDLQEFLSGSSKITVTCATAPSSGNQEEIEKFKSLGADIQQTFCCTGGNNLEDQSKGPLLQLLESESESFKALGAGEKAELCIRKTAKDSKKDFLSSDGLSECAGSFLQGLTKLIKDTLKTISSLFDLETIKALGQFVANMPDSGKDLIKIIGEHLGGQLYSVTDCMSPYESKQYICKMIPSVTATLLGPQMIKSFAKAVIDKSGKSALALMISKAAQENKSFQNLVNIASSVSNRSSKLSRPILQSKMIKPGLELTGKISAFLGKDISTPLKDMVIEKAKKLVSLRTPLPSRPAIILTKITPPPALIEVPVVAESLSFDGSRLTKAEQKLLEKAHQIGLNEGRNVTTFTSEDLAAKIQLLERAGINNPADQQFLIKNGIKGVFKKEKPKVAAVNPTGAKYQSIDPDIRIHILDSDQKGGGHRFGTNKPGKSEFPKEWDDEKILREIISVTNDPASTRGPGKYEGTTEITGTRDGVVIVVMTNEKRIYTAYPTNLGRNPE